MSNNSKSRPLTFLCLASYEKGHRFMQEAKNQGCRVYLLTSQSLRDTAQFPHQSLDDVFYWMTSSICRMTSMSGIFSICCTGLLTLATIQN